LGGRQFVTLKRPLYEERQPRRDAVKITGAIPEPQTCALMLAGLGVMGFVARRRRPR